MFFMGVGSYLSKFIRKRLFEAFITIEIILGAVGGISATALYFIYAETDFYYIYNFLFIGFIGLFAGMEIPIVARIINKYSSLKETMAKVFSFDYIGALAASVLFPLLLLPWLGLIKTAFLIGIINLFVALYNAWMFRNLIRSGKMQSTVSLILILVFSGGLIFSADLSKSLEQKVYQDKIIYSKQTPYQKIVLTRWNNDFRMFINGAIQFSSTDEYRYHESLVHIPMSLSQSHEKILVLGGGDGLVIKQILKYPEVNQIHLVDLDPEITRLAKENDFLKKLNDNALNHPKVKVFNKDAYNFIEKSSDVYSLIIADLPDPNDTGLGKLYTEEFYQMLATRLDKTGLVVTQASSPYFSPEAFWCIKHTLDSVFDTALPYQTNVPTFGIWGFVAAGPGLDFINARDSSHFKQAVIKKITKRLFNEKFSDSLRYLNPEKIPGLFRFERDLQERKTKTNKLSSQMLVKYYNQSADNWR